MHVLIIPSEEYLPKENPLLGIFQRDQAEALAAKGVKVGVMGVSLRFSPFMLLRAILVRFLTGVDIKGISEISKNKLILLFVKCIFNINSFELEEKSNINLCFARGFYSTRPGFNSSYKQWRKTSLDGFKKYTEFFGKPDIIHAHNVVYAGFIAGEISKKYNIPFLITEHSSLHGLQDISPKLTKKINESFSNANRLIVVSPFLKNLLIKKYNIRNKEIIVIPNLLPADFEKCLQLKEKKEKPSKFITVGRMDKNKNHLMLLQSFCNFLKEEPNARLTLVGDGEERKYLQEFVDVEGINDSVVFKGRLSRVDILNELLISDVFVLPSNFETFGVVLIEALACGLPVISTKSGGPNFFVQEENGVLVKVNSKNDLTRGFKEVNQKFSLFNKEEIRETVIANFGKEKISSLLIKEYSYVVCLE